VLFSKIVAERIAAAKLGVNATPTFLVNDEKIVGMTPFEEFDRRFKALLKI
jgi:protein-disulfide isomerase